MPYPNISRSNFPSKCAATEISGIIRRTVHEVKNNAQFDLPEFNQLFEQARALPDSPERTKLFDRMTELVIAYAPWRLTYHLLEDSVRHKWVKTYVPHPIRSEWWQFIDIDVAARNAR